MVSHLSPQIAGTKVAGGAIVQKIRKPNKLNMISVREKEKR